MGEPKALEMALRVTLRRLEEEVLPRRVAFWAPREVAALFEGLVARVGLEAMLDHAIATWLEAGAQFEDYADFERDGFRWFRSGDVRTYKREGVAAHSSGSRATSCANQGV